MELTDTVITRRTILAVFFAALVIAGYWSLRLTWADWLSQMNDVAQIRRAVALSPGNAEFRVNLARILDDNGADPTEALQLASVLNPTDANLRVRLGLRAEMRGDSRSAERQLLQAARLSRQFEPRWTLANFYFRRNDPAHFWPWIHQALVAGTSDLTPVFTLCWNMSHDPALILNRAIPEQPAILNAYLGFLLRRNEPIAAAQVARILAPLAAASDCPALLAAIDGMLNAGDSAAALDIWNRMCQRGILPYPPLDPSRNAALTDGSFMAEPAGGGFGWRVAPISGTNCGRNDSPAYLWLSFSGNQPAAAEPLSQYLVLIPGDRYRLLFRYRTSDMPPESGLRWQVVDPRNGAVLPSSSPWLSSPAWRTGEVIFTASTNPLARLVLTYQAVPGAPRLDGSVLLSDLQLERLL